ncbi:hypothetical protein [Nonomuraea indica]|uniref:hypothetical protein n=1 Tax=Nonomuraea indica TaxID=1581193 RepID=UPI000C7C0393|nr:hypothetical protein [Nonomuraea indica]
MRRVVASAAVALALAAAGCANLSSDYNDPTQLHRPQNDGANGTVDQVHVRNAFMLGPEGAASRRQATGRPTGEPGAHQPGGQPTATPGQPTGQPGGGKAAAGELPLYAVLVNDRSEAVRLEQVTIEGGGTVRLAGAVEVPPGGIAGADRPIGTVSGASTRTWLPMTFTFAAGPRLKLMVPVLARSGMYATYSPSPQGVPTGSPPPATATPSPAPTGSP